MSEGLDQAQSSATVSNRQGMRGRLIRGVGATALSPIATALIQLGSVPLLLHAWGAAKYGDWLLLSAIPTYLGLSDLGFGDASGSDMCMRVGANDREGALETFQSSWVLVTAVSLLALLLASLSVWWIPWQHWLRLSSISSPHAALIMLVLATYVLVAQQNGVTESGYRCDGNFATGAFWATILRLSEAAAATTVAVIGGSLLAVATTYLTVRFLGSIGYAGLMRATSPWIHYGIRHARWKIVKRLAAPAFGFMALPLGHAISFQGLTVAIGVLLGPVAVVAFSTLRTLSRTVIQSISVVKSALWPELSTAFGAGDIDLARRLHRRLCQACLLVSVCGAGLLWLLGPTIYRIWIGHRVVFDAACFHVLLLGIVTDSFWETSGLIPVSLNAHCRIAVAFVASSLFSLGIACVLLPRVGIVGAAIALIATDLWMISLVLRTTLRQVQDNFSSFVKSLFSVPSVARTRKFLSPTIGTARAPFSADELA